MTEGPAGAPAARPSALLAVTFFKASQVLMVYLNLRLSTQGWKVLFHAFLIAIVVPILGAYAIAASLHR